MPKAAVFRQNHPTGDGKVVLRHFRMFLAVSKPAFKRTGAQHACSPCQPSRQFLEKEHAGCARCSTRNASQGLLTQLGQQLRSSRAAEGLTRRPKQGSAVGCPGPSRGPRPGATQAPLLLPHWLRQVFLPHHQPSAFTPRTSASIKNLTQPQN